MKSINHSIRKTRDLSVLLVALLYSFGFACLEIYMQNNGYTEKTIAILACSHNIISTFFCAFLFIKYIKLESSIFWVLGFIVVGVADVFHGVFNWIYPISALHLLSTLNGCMYLLFVVLHARGIAKTLRGSMKRIDYAVVLAIALTFFGVTFCCMTLPLIQRMPLVSGFNVIDIAYNITVSVLIGFVVFFGLRSKNLIGMIYSGAYLLIFCSGFALDALSYLGEAGPKITIFNYGWELGFSIIAATFFYALISGRSIDKMFEIFPMNSLRFQVSSISFASILCLVGLLRIINIPSTFWQNTDVSVLLVLFLIAWNVSNLFALSLSKKLYSLEKMLSTKDLQSVDLQYEIEQVVDIYRRQNKELINANTTIQAQQRSLEMLTKQIAHDVRRPLTGLKAMLCVLPSIKEEPEMIKKMMEDVDKNIDNTNMMLSEMLDFSKGVDALNLSKCDPEKIFSDAVKTVFQTKPGADVKTRYDLQSKCFLNADQFWLTRVVENIVTNAVEAMDNKGNLWFKTKDIKDGSGLRMQIIIGNDGPEIPPEIQAKIFDPFFTKGKKEGTGLGLAITKKIIEMHGAELRLDSRAGSTEFTFDLPAIAPDKFKQKRGDTNGMKSVLILNDDVDVLTAMGIMLKTPGVQILKSSNMTDAVETLTQHRIDCIFSDINLKSGSVNGYDFLKHVRENIGSTPFYFISGYSKSDEWPQAEKLGADGYYQLPIDFTILKEVIV